MDQWLTPRFLCRVNGALNVSTNYEIMFVMHSNAGLRYDVQDL